MTQSPQTTPELQEELKALRARVAQLEEAERECVRAVEALQESEKRYRAIVEDQTEMLSRHLPGGILTYVNGALAKFVGQDREELLGRSYFPFLPEEDRKQLIDHLASLELNNPIGAIEHRVVLPNGDVRWLQWTNRAIFGEQGEVVEFQSVGRDITERKEADRALLETQQQLQHLLRSGPAVIYSCGPAPEYATTFISENVFGMLGFRTEQFLDNPHFWERQIHPDDVARVLEELARAETAEAVSYEYRFRHRSGNYVWLHDRLAPIREPTGKLSGLVGSWFDITDRKRAEEGLRESETRYRSLFDGVPVGLYRSTPSGRILAANPALVRMLGCPDRDSLLETNAGSLYVESNDRQRLLQEIDRSGVALDLEFQLRCCDGAPIWVKESTRTIRDSSGTVQFYEGSLEDITKRKETESALRESERRYRAIVQDQTDLICRFAAPDATLTFVNDAYARFFGKRRKELIGHSFLPLIPEEDHEWVRRNIAELGPDNPVGRQEHRVTAADGTTHWQQWTNRVILDADARVVELQGVGHDTTERKETERRLAASERRYRELYEGAHDGFGMVDMDGRFIECNHTFTQMLGNSKDELHRMTYVDLTPERWHAFEADIVHEQVLTRGFSDVYEKELRRKDGTIFPVELRAYLLRDEVGAPAGMWAFVRDVTARKEAEAGRERLEAQLRHAHKMQAVGQLAAGVAHDFNSLLMVVLGNAELILSRMKRGKPDNATSADATALRQIVQAVERGTAMVQRLMTIGRAHTWKPQVVDLNETIVVLERMVRPLIGDQVHFKFMPGADVRPIYADPGQLEEAIVNLILNARDAMPEGGKLTIETDSMTFNEEYAASQIEAHFGPHTLLMVSDTGAGMSEEILQRLFEPFYSTKPVDKGTGLGLSIVHGIVKQAGGHVEVKSAPDKGSTFRLYFPAME